MKISHYYTFALFLSTAACKAEAPSKTMRATRATAHIGVPSLAAGLLIIVTTMLLSMKT